MFDLKTFLLSKISIQFNQCFIKITVAFESLLLNPHVSKKKSVTPDLFLRDTKTNVEISSDLNQIGLCVDRIRWRSSDPQKFKTCEWLTGRLNKETTDPVGMRSWSISHVR